MPAWISVEDDRKIPTCKDKSCEQREHWVTVRLGEDMLRPMHDSITAMETALSEIEFEISQDSEGPKAPTMLIIARDELRGAIKSLAKVLKAVDGRPL